jgi:SAM-dependent methyltransferase
MERLEPTGERLIPHLQHGELVHAEHLARYRLAAQLAPSRRTLDAACGEGYGTAILAAAGARAATGVDLDAATIQHARGRHPQADFLAGDVRELPFRAGSFDLVVSFETIEHIRDAERALDELRRVTAPDGLLLISTPNKHEYLVENEFHEREFFHAEFLELLEARFETVEVLLQHNWLTSAVLPVPVAADAGAQRDHQLEFRKLAAVMPGAELYTIALCGTEALPRLRPVAVAAAVDEAQELARRAVDAERTAEMWHAEYQKAEAAYKTAERALFDVYGSVWWRMTGPLRRLLELVRGGGGARTRDG